MTLTLTQRMSVDERWRRADIEMEWKFEIQTYNESFRSVRNIIQNKECKMNRMKRKNERKYWIEIYNQFVTQVNNERKEIRREWFKGAIAIANENLPEMHIAGYKKREALGKFVKAQLLNMYPCLSASVEAYWCGPIVLDRMSPLDFDDCCLDGTSDNRSSVSSWKSSE